MTQTATPPELTNLPATSFLRLYDPQTHGNSFALDGFPALKSGTTWPARLVDMIAQRGVLNMTTNQTLFRQLLETGVLDERLRAFKADGRDAAAAWQVLYNEAATEAARLFAPVHARWPWEGRVSQEASALITELDPLVREVRRIAAAMQGVSSFTKIPNLKIGPQAVRQAVAGGSVNPNITLVFSDRHYLDTVEGYLDGLKQMVEKKEGDPAQVHSVNSLFVSRVDRVADPMIEQALRRAVHPEPESKDERLAQGERLLLLKGKVAVAQAKKIYQIFEAIFLGKPFADPLGLYADTEGQQMRGRIDRLRDLFARLRGAGANPQRLLIASSGVKLDQPYSPLLYVLPFLGPWSANTMPEGTLDAVNRFVSGLSDDQAESLRRRNLMAEPLPAIPTDAQPREEWDRVLLLTPAQRRAEGIGELSADQVLREAQELLFAPQGTSLRAIGDTLRDKGAQSFTADEQATLQLIENKFQNL